jgi:acyl carrier protein
MTSEERLSMFREIATEVVERDFSGVSPSTPITELGIDSLGMLEIIGEMERRLRIRLPDEALNAIETVQNLLEAVERRQLG